MEMNKEQLKKHFDQQIEKSQNAFNIFSALHIETDERQLHSRFISYLLSTNKEFLKSFVYDILKIEDFDTNNYKVFPNEEYKSELKNIDILILDKEKSKAIIIENKIFAGDSNGKDENGKEIPQLLVYFNEIRKEDEFKKMSDDEAKTNIKLVYLKLNKKKPSLYEQLKDYDLTCIEYVTDIKDWLEKCQTTIEKEDDFLAKTINQYKELIIKLTSDIDKAKRNQEIISKNIADAWKLQEHNKYFTKDCFEIFRHIQWHTVDDFFNELIAKLEEEENTKTTEIPSLEDITTVTHNKNQSSITKLIVRFTYNNVKLQIVNDTKGFTLGNLCEGKWDEFSSEINKIKFNDFSIKDTFRIINKDHRERVIKEIIVEAKNKYLDLENDFE
mgnify:CR=1 FL=1